MDENPNDQMADDWQDIKTCPICDGIHDSCPIDDGSGYDGYDYEHERYYYDQQGW